MDLSSSKNLLATALLKNNMEIIPPEADNILSTMSDDKIIEAFSRITAQKVNTVDGVLAILNEYKIITDIKNEAEKAIDDINIIPSKPSFSITLSEQSGELSIDKNAPQKAEKYSIKLEKSSSPKPLSNSQVTEHTASLWKYNPIPENEPEKHDEYHIKHFSTKAFEVTGARARGKKHKHEGTNCDDWFETSVSEDWLCVAVSDGAGSKKFSRIGARIACEVATDTIKKEIEVLKSNALIINMLSSPLNSTEFMSACGMIAPIVQKGITEAANAIAKEFEKQRENKEFISLINRDLMITDFSCTLLLLLAIPLDINGHKERFIVTAQVGDGMIAAINTNEEYSKALKLLGEADSGEFSGETEFITSSQMIKPEKLMKKTRITRGTSNVILMMTDGVADDYYPSDPQMKRLYLDLEANGILKASVDNMSNADITKIPEPILYQWVNNPEIKIPLQYTKNVLDTSGLTLEELWANNSVRKKMALESFEWSLSENNNKGESLKVWIDNYVERGSFDDRTMVIIEYK